MGRFTNQYIQKLVSAEAAVSFIKSGDWIDYTMAHGVPIKLDRALAARKNELNDIKVRSCLSLAPLEIINADPQGEVFTYSNWHFGIYDRKLHDQRRCFYIPLLYRNMPTHYRNTLDVDVAMVSVAPMDSHGYFNLSLINSATKAILDKAKIVIVEINDNLPRVFGIKDECIHISEVDFIVEGDNLKLQTIKSRIPSEADIKIANYIIEEIRNGSVLQLGIGGLPNVVGELLAESDVRDIGMHTEMLVDAYLLLYEKGKLTNRSKNINKDKGVWSFCIGSNELYDWARDNTGIASAPIDYTNSPEIMAQNDNLI